MSGQVLEQCGSEGGCAYYADLRGTEGQYFSGEIGALSGLPARLPVGVYTLTLRSSLVGDVIVDGAPPDESPDATCSTAIKIEAGQERITARGLFRADSCEIRVSVT